MSDPECPVCAEAFTSEKGVRDHTWDAHDACHHCSEQFDDQDALYTHWLEDHANVLSDRDRKRARNRVGDRTVCPVCEERFGGTDAVRSHTWDSHGACHLCGAAFDQRETVAAHWLGAHDAALAPSTRDRATAEVGDLSLGQRLTHQGPLAAVSGVRVSRRAMVGGSAIGIVALLGGAAATGQFGTLGGGEASLEDHAAGQRLASQPTLGPTPAEADGTIVAFEDPSCPSCARFETETFPEVKARLIEPGTVSFVFRSIPVVKAWAEPATLALESVHTRDPAQFWGLKAFYFDNQRNIGDDNVHDETRRYLSERTDLDADAVMTDVDQETYGSAVETNLQAATEADVGGTPTFYLFSQGTYQTKIVGPQSYSVFRDSLGV